MTAIDKLKNLLAEHDRLLGEKLRHEKMDAQLLIEENQLLRTANLEDRAQFEKINQLRLKRQIIPGKLQAYADAIAQILADLTRELARVLARHRAAVQSRTAELKDQLARTLAPYFAPESTQPNHATLLLHEHETGLLSAARAAARIAAQSLPGKFLFDQDDTLRNGNFLSQPVPVRARRLLDMITAFENLKI